MYHKRLSGKTCLITGAAQGLGEAIAERFSTEGAQVIIADINFEAARSVAARIGGDAVKCDVCCYDDCVAATEFALAQYGSIDILVANAAILISGRILDFSPQEWKKVVDVNLCGSFNIIKAAAPSMLEKKSGSIIQINSKSGKEGSARNSAYSASKFGGIGLVQSLALEFAEHNVRVNAICPGNLLDSPLWVNSLYYQYSRNQGISREQVRKNYINQVPMKKGCSYFDVSSMAVYLATDEAAYITGQSINVSGGQVMH
ncbi:MAG: SDR family NAD(P)-dependent oxidoreductase [Christensenellales bacterium]